MSGLKDDPYAQLYTVDVTVLRGIKLKKADLGGLSDPYVVVEVDGLRQRSKTIQNTLDPMWNETKTFLFTRCPEYFAFKVYDEDKGGDRDRLGYYKLNFADADWDKNNAFFSKLTLKDVKRGEIEIRIVWKKIVPNQERLARMEARCNDVLDENEKMTIAVANADKERVKARKEHNELVQLRGEIHSVKVQLHKANQRIEKQDAMIEAKESQINQLTQAVAAGASSGSYDKAKAKAALEKSKAEAEAKIKAAEKAAAEKAQREDEALAREEEEAKRKTENPSMYIEAGLEGILANISRPKGVNGGAQLDAKGVTKEVQNGALELEKGEKVLFHYQNKNGSQTKNCCIITNNRLIKIEDGRLSVSHLLELIEVVEHQKNGLFHWDKVWMKFRDSTMETGSMGINGDNACAFFVRVLQEIIKIKDCM